MLFTVKYCKNYRKMTVHGLKFEIQQNNVNFMSNFPSL